MESISKREKDKSQFNKMGMETVLTFNGGECKKTCNCIEIAEYKNNGPVKSYPCLEPEEPMLAKRPKEICLIVKDTGIHVSDGEVTVICQNQTQAKDMIELHHTWCLDDLKKDHPYPIPGLRFEVKGVCCSPLAPNINHHGDCDRCSFYSEVAILSLEETKEESQEEQKAISDELWNAGELYNPTDFHAYVQKHFNPITRK